MILVNKPISLTPLQVIQQLKVHYSELTHQTISYAGRLDPMAEGLLLLLVGDENKERKTYEDMKKTYEFTVLLGIETDTYDILGRIQQNNQYRLHRDQIQSELMTEQFSKILPSFLGKSSQQYPPYSSKTVNGKPLYWWAREGKLHEITIPQRDIHIYDAMLLKQTCIAKNDLFSMIIERIKTVKGEFRQEEIIHYWTDFFSKDCPSSFSLFHCSISCSSGTYIRGVAHEIGKRLGYGAITLDIKRIQIGDYMLSEAIQLPAEN